MFWLCPVAILFCSVKIVSSHLMKRLGPAHDRFIAEYVRTGEIGPSYRAAFPRCKSFNASRVNGHYLLKRPYIAARVEQVRQRMAKRSDITIEKVLTDYQEALNIAKSQEKANEIVMAATAQAKLVGLLRDRIETGNAGEFDALDNLSEIVEKIAAEAGPEAAVRFMTLVNATKQVSEPSSDTGLEDLPAASEAKN